MCLDTVFSLISRGSSGCPRPHFFVVFFYYVSCDTLCGQMCVNLPLDSQQAVEIFHDDKEKWKGH